MGHTFLWTVLGIANCVYATHIPSVSTLQYTLDFPHNKARYLETDQQLRKLRRHLTERYDCTSLDGPFCPSGEAEAIEEEPETTQDVLVQKDRFSAENIQKLVYERVKGERLNPTPDLKGKKGGKSSADAWRNSAEPEEARQVPYHKKPREQIVDEIAQRNLNEALGRDFATELGFAAATRTAAVDVKCDLCRAITREVWWQATELEGKSFGSASDDKLEVAVRDTCKGQVPPLLTKLSVVPRGTSAGYALGERGQPKTLSGFEAISYKRACEMVVELADQDIVASVHHALEGARQNHKAWEASGHISIDLTDLQLMQETACRPSALCEAVHPPMGFPVGVGGEVEVLLAAVGTKCVYMSAGWWTYELCPHKHILQFHVDKHQTTSTILLGEFDEVATANILGVSLPHLEPSDLLPGMRQMLPYHSHVFTQGDPCDGADSDADSDADSAKRVRRRRTHVRWACSPDGQVHLVVREPSVCKYVLVLYLPELCTLPEFSLFKMKDER